MILPIYACVYKYVNALAKGTYTLWQYINCELYISPLVLPSNIILHRLVHDQSIVKDSDSTPTHFFGMRIWTHAGA